MRPRPPARALLVSTLLLVTTASPAPAATPGTAPAVPGATPTTRPAGPQSAARTEELEAVVRRCDRLLATVPDDVSILQSRAEAQCLLGRVGPSVRDFDRVAALEPRAATHNWQRGIALYYAGRFKDGAEQFEQHRTVNPQDVENAAWHYLCLSKALGPEAGPAAARAKLIPIRSDPRVPLMTVHEMYAGRATPADALAAAEAGRPAADDLRERLFYGHLYVALFHEANGRRADAARHARLAATTYAVDGYMGDVARLHMWLSEGKTTGAATAPAVAPSPAAGERR